MQNSITAHTKKTSKMNLISLGNIQKGKSIFMGFAILWVIAFHYSFLAGTPLYGISQKGNLGVDIFILLSSFGLCFSLKKNSSYKDFIKRRFKRIIPTWWLLITIMLIVNILLHRSHPQSLLQYICYYSGIGWWTFYNVEYGIYYYEWYIPTLLMFYLFTPLLYKLNNKRIILLFAASIIAASLLRHYCIAIRLSLSYERIPAFIYGIILYKMYCGEMNEKIYRKYLYISSIAGIAAFAYAMMHKTSNGFVLFSFMFAMPMLLNICYLAFRGIPGKILSFIGTLTLELYMLHIYNLPLFAVLKVIGNRDIAIIATAIILIGASYIASRIMSRITSKW